MQTILLVQTYDNHPAHTLTRYALLGFTDSTLDFIRRNSEADTKKPWTDSVILFLNGDCCSTTGDINSQDIVQKMFGNIDPLASVQTVRPDIAEVIGYDSDGPESDSIELEEDSTFIEYMVYGGEMLFRFRAEHECDEYTWHLGTAWISFKDLGLEPLD